MNYSVQSINGYITRHRNFSGLIYVGLVVGCLMTVAFMLSELADQYQARNASIEMLSRYANRGPLISKQRPPGSPFLEGQTLTTASAALLQRITTIITNAGGTLVSTEIVQRGTQSKDGYVTALANCEIEQESLQKVLYEIEAGLPYLFIDQLQIQAPLEAGQGERLRLLLGVTGFWTGAK
jgi:general secretion pathway protein M